MPRARKALFSGQRQPVISSVEPFLNSAGPHGLLVPPLPPEPMGTLFQARPRLPHVARDVEPQLHGDDWPGQDSTCCPPRSPLSLGHSAPSCPTQDPQATQSAAILFWGVSLGLPGAVGAVHVVLALPQSLSLSPSLSLSQAPCPVPLLS